jgi:hypothetical protein
MGPGVDPTISVQVFCDEVVTGGGGEGPAPALSEHVVGGDLLLVMNPGFGRGEEAELLALSADPLGTFGVKEGTADHVAWFDGEYRPMQVVTFTAGRDNPRGGDPEFCVVIGGGGGCGFDPDEPTIHGWAVGEANAFGGAGGAEAVFTTESANTVSVLTVGGYARAEWPREWGQPQTVEFYDTSGSLLVRLDFQTDSGG